MTRAKKTAFGKPLIIANIFLFVILFTLTFHFFIRPLIVTPPVDKVLVKAEAQKIANTCQGTDGNKAKKCYEEKLGTLAQNMGFAYAEQALYVLQDIDPFTWSCHVIAHRIAEAATRRDPNSWRKILDEVNLNTCAGGFLHGVLEGHIGSTPSLEINSQEINELCSSNSKYKKKLCAHLLGHLLLFQKDGKMEDAFAICNGVKDELKFECFAGIFMEDHQKNNMVDHGLAKPPEFTNTYVQKLAQRCDSFDELKSSACWKEMAEIFTIVHGYNQEKVFRSCSQAKIETAQVECYLEGVSALVTHPIYDSLDRISRICNPYEMNQKLFERCISVALSVLINNTDKFTDRALLICSNIKNGQPKEDCFRNLGEWLKRKETPLSQRELLCTDAPEPYKKLCIGRNKIIPFLPFSI